LPFNILNAQLPDTGMALCKSTDIPMSETLKTETLRTEKSESTLPPEPPSELPTMVRSQSGSKKSHDEKHSDYGNIVRDVIIGFADGLTVPFALTAGLSSFVHLLIFHVDTQLMPR
jgi:hypothetical protein